MGDGRGSNTVAAFNSVGTLLWRYDTGNDANGNVIGAGQPQIDASGNVYIPWESGGANNHVGVLKLDSSGALLWSYDHGTNSGAGNSAPQSSDFDNNGNIVFRTPYHATGTFATEFALVVSPSGSLVTTYKWVGTGVTQPLVVWYGLAVDTNGNLYASSDQSNQISKFDSSATFVVNFSGSGSIVCDKTNGKLYVYEIASGAPASGSAIGSRWDLSTTTPTQDWSKTYNNIFSADSVNYSETSRPKTGASHIGFDASTGNVSIAIGSVQSDLGGRHVVSQVLNQTGSSGAKNYYTVLDAVAGAGQITGDYIGVDGVGSNIVAASEIGTSVGSYTMFGVTAGGVSWANATLAPGGTSPIIYKGLAMRTYTP